MNCILIGPQGCGKGTQAKRMLQEYPFSHIEAGHIIRTASKEHSRKGEIIDHIVNQRGELLPDGVVLELIEEYIQQIDLQWALFDGFPRTMTQFTALEDILEGLHTGIDLGIYIHISDEEAIQRLSSRRVSADGQTSYSLLLEPNRTHDDQGKPLIQRPDDKPEAIQKRLQIYHQMTAPILDQLEEKGLLRQIDGEQEIDDVFSDITRYLEKQL